MRQLKKIFRSALLIPLLLLITIPVKSQSIELQNKLKTITIDEAIKIALENNHDNKIAIHNLKVADEKINQAWSMIFPILESEASMGRQSAENGLISLSDGQNDIKFIKMRLGVNPGLFYNSLKLSRESFKSAKEEARKIRNEVSFNVIKSYFNIISTQEIVKLRKDSINHLKENLKDVNNLYRTGTVPKFDLLQAQVRLDSQVPLLLEAENNNRIAIQTLNYHLGLDRNEYTVDESILYSNNIIEPAQMDEKIISRLSQIALKNRPEIIQIKNKSIMSSYSRDMARSYYLWPTFSINGSYGKTQFLPADSDNPMINNISGNRDWQTTWQIQAAATYRWGSLFPIDSKQSEVRENEILIKKADEEFLKIKNIINISIKTGYSNLITSYSSIAARKKNVKTSEEGLRIARDGYRAGILKNSDLLSAEVDLTNAKMGLIQAANQYFISLADLKKELSIDDEKIIFEEGKNE